MTRRPCGHSPPPDISFFQMLNKNVCLLQQAKLGNISLSQLKIYAQGRFLLLCFLDSMVPPLHCEKNDPAINDEL